MRGALAAAILAIAQTALAHVGSPDVFFEGLAGPYGLLVAIRTPQAIPGVAEIEVRTDPDPAVHRVRITPMPLTGEGAKFAPVPDEAAQSREDPRFFTGALWMMTSGSWQVRIQVDGNRGRGETAVPVPAVARRTERMSFALGMVLGILLIVLGTGVISIVGAASREALLDPGAEPGPANIGQARRWMAITALGVVAALCLGNVWWSVEANAYDRYIYKPLEMSATVDQGQRLVLRLRDPGWLRTRMLDDFIPDHAHLMHLFVVRLPEIERAWHLHPELAETGVFTQQLPPMPAGRYRLYADLVHATGFPETITTEVELPEIAAGRPLQGDDSAATAPPLSAANSELMVGSLPDGHKMIWLRDLAPLAPRQLQRLRFRIEDAAGDPARDIELYMGMPGHLMLVKHDGSVFAHVHPTGSVPMAALGLANGAPDPHAAHASPVELPNEISFPYGFPSGGDYRLFVQVKRAGRIETGVFDAKVR
jgi:hypothetical protein